MRPSVPLTVIALTAACAVNPNPAPQGPTGPYLGQVPPGPTARLFAPGLVSTGAFERDAAFTPDGRELYFTVVLGERFVIVVMAQDESGRWSGPEVAPFSGRSKDLEPVVSPDGSRLLFVSDRPGPGRGEGRDDFDIWTMERNGGGWGPPAPLGPEVNTERNEFYPSVTRDGTLYFTRNEGEVEGIFRARRSGDGEPAVERLPEAVNGTAAQFNAFIAADESYLIFGSIPRGEVSFGRADYYVCFRRPDDTWTEAVNLGPEVNSAGNEYCPSVTPDGRYFVFNSTRAIAPEPGPDGRLDYAALAAAATGPGNGQSDVYWIDAGFLDTLRPAMD